MLQIPPLAPCANPVRTTAAAAPLPPPAPQPSPASGQAEPTDALTVSPGVTACAFAQPAELSFQPPASQASQNAPNSQQPAASPSTPAPTQGSPPACPGSAPNPLPNPAPGAPSGTVPTAPASPTPSPAFAADFSHAETALLAAKYLSDNPETVVLKGSGVLAPELALPSSGVSRISFYHSFVTADQKQAYVTVSAAQGGSFYLRGLGASINNPLNASLEANAAYPGHAPKITILKPDGSSRPFPPDSPAPNPHPVPLAYNTISQRYEPAIELQPGERAFIEVGPRVGATSIANQTQLNQARENSAKTLVAHLDLEPVSGASLSAGTYAEGTEKDPRDKGLTARDYARAEHKQDADSLQKMVKEQALTEVYGEYPGAQPGKNTLNAHIKPHHSVYIELDPSGVIPYNPADVGIDSQTGQSFVRLIGARDGQARVDDNLNGIPNESGALIYPNPSGSRVKGTSNYEATSGFVMRKTPGQPTLADEGDKDGYGLPYQLPNQLFNTPNATPGNGTAISSGRLFLRGDPPQYDKNNPLKTVYTSKYAVTIIDANNRTKQILIGARDNNPTATGSPATHNSFWSLDLGAQGNDLTLPIRIITHEGSDLGLQVFYEPPGSQTDFAARAIHANAKDPNSPLKLPSMSE